MVFPAKKRARFEESHWWYLGRRKIITAILNSLPLPLASRILEIGCGCGTNLQKFQSFAEAYGGDSDIEACVLAHAKSPGKVLAFKGEHLPFENCTFDVVLLLDTLEHIENEIAVLREVHRVLRPEGFVVITLPAFPALFWRHDIAESHLRRYTKKMLLQLAGQANLTIEKISYFNALLFLPIALLRLIGKTLFRAREGLDFREVPQPLNDFFATLLAFERRSAIRFSIPFGLSLIGLLRKKGKTLPTEGLR